MFKDKDLQAIAVQLRVDPDEFVKKAKSDQDEEIEVQTLHTQADLETLRKNRFNEGKAAMEEILVKELKTEHKIEIDSKSINDFVPAFQKKVITDAGIEPAKQVKEKEDVITALKKQLSYKDGEIATEKKSKFQLRKDFEILNLLPKNTVLPKGDVLALYKLNHSVTNEEGKTVITKDGVIQKNNLHEALDLKQSISQYIDSRPDLVKKKGMNGDDEGDDGSSIKFHKMSEYLSYCENNNLEALAQKNISDVLGKNKADNFNKDN